MRSLRNFVNFEQKSSIVSGAALKTFQAAPDPPGSCAFSEFSDGVKKPIA
jgi:hypothetical protein